MSAVTICYKKHLQPPTTKKEKKMNNMNDQILH